MIINLKEKILESSRHILALEGYEGLSMRKIATSVGCKAASIYHHFENKDKIVHTLIDEGYQLQFKEMENAVAGITNPLERIKARSLAYVDFGLNHPEYYHIMYILITRNMARYPKENYRRNAINMSKTIDDLKEAHTQGMTNLQEAPEIVANASTAMLHGLIALFLSNRLHIKLDKEKIKRLVIEQALATGRI